MKTSKTTIETFATDALKKNQMNFLLGGGDPLDITIPPDGWGEGK